MARLEKVYVGSQLASAVYAGAVKIWPLAPVALAQITNISGAVITDGTLTVTWTNGDPQALPVVIELSKQGGTAADEIVSGQDGLPAVSSNTQTTYTFNNIPDDYGTGNIRLWDSTQNDYVDGPISFDVTTTNTSPNISNLTVSGDPTATVTITANDSDAGDTWTYEVNWEGTWVQSGISNTHTHTYGTDGAKTVYVRATDNHGLTGNTGSKGFTISNAGGGGGGGGGTLASIAAPGNVGAGAYSLLNTCIVGGALNQFALSKDGGTVLIENCYFENLQFPLRFENCTSVIVRGCYFKNCGWGIRIDNCSAHLQLDDNVFENWGVLDVNAIQAGGFNKEHAIQVVGFNGAYFSVSRNVADRIQDTRPNLKDNTFAEDVLNFSGVVLSGTNRHIDSNILRGANVNESNSAGGIIIDGWSNPTPNQNIVVSNNRILNTGQYILGDSRANAPANAPLIFDNNIGYLSAVHSANLREPKYVNEGFLLDSGFGVAHTSAGVAGTIGYSEFRNNRIVGYRGTWGPLNNWDDNATLAAHSVDVNNNFLVQDAWNATSASAGPLSDPTESEVLSGDIIAQYGSTANHFDRSQVCS